MPLMAMRRRRDHLRPAGLDLSVLIPVFNEAENVEPLHGELDAMLRPLSLRYELIFVDDGSADGTVGPARTNPGPRSRARAGRLPLAELRPDRRVSAALDLARGEILVPMDGDLQNDPADIPRLLETLEKGYDVVSGWRRIARTPCSAARSPRGSPTAWWPGSPACRCTTSAARSRPIVAGCSRASGSTARCTGSSRSSPPGKGRG